MMSLKKIDYESRRIKIKEPMTEEKFLNEKHPMFLKGQKVSRTVVKQMLKEYRKDVIEECKGQLLKQLHPVKHKLNDYPFYAVPKSTILSLGKLIK